MKDKIISFILTIIIIGILGVIGYTGFMIYNEIMLDGTIEINFQSDTGFPSIQYVPNTKQTIEQILSQSIFEGVNETTHVNADVNNSINLYKSRYLYQQLNDTAKVIYTKLYENKENLKTGTYKVDFENVFQSVLSKEDGGAELQSCYQSAIEALIYENPEMFYLDVTKMYINIEKITKITGTRYNVYISNGDEDNYLIDGLYSKKDVLEYEAKIEQIKNVILANLSGKSQYNQIKIVHDYLIDTIEYDETISEDNIYNIYGALINKKCVCEGYAKAFQYLMNEAGIENILVVGTGTNSKNHTENHAWNYVKLSGNWYAIDVTWDDPIITGGGSLTNKLRYKYFLKGADVMDANHFASGKFTTNGKSFRYPQLNVENY